jgi:hypothetical protein
LTRPLPTYNNTCIITCLAFVSIRYARFANELVDEWIDDQSSDGFRELDQEYYKDLETRQGCRFSSLLVELELRVLVGIDTRHDAWVLWDKKQYGQHLIV